MESDTSFEGKPNWVAVGIIAAMFLAFVAALYIGLN